MMGTRLRIIPAEGAWGNAEVGDMWRTPGNDHEGRECWFIRLPGEHAYWYTTAGETGQDGWNAWEVTGEPPNITVRPSIAVYQGWHGFITDGELSDA